MIRVVGSAIPQKEGVYIPEGSQQFEVEAENSQASDNVIKRKGRILLTDKSTRPVKTDRTLDKIPEKSFKKTKGVTPKESEDETLKKLKAMNLSEDELAFL